MAASVVKGKGKKGIMTLAKQKPATTSNFNLRGGRGK